MNFFHKTARRKFRIHDTSIVIHEYRSAIHNTYGMVKDLQREERNYNLDRIMFEAGDIIVDIGANVGVVSIYLAKCFPFTTVYAYEPVPDNYRHLTMNIAANGVTNIKPFNRAVTADGRDITINVSFDNSGGATAWAPKADDIKYDQIPSTTVDTILTENRISKCKLLKIDCEGGEYEALLHARKLSRVEYLSGEFHTNSFLTSKGYTPKRLLAHLTKSIRAEKIKYHECGMAE
ncbi:MAG: FkbM family methyltransferase [Spirochaetes bacterium]|nr:FkbM family methyltransferase [Spirochaetota bacterium]